jgi:hypothetical protein
VRSVRPSSVRRPVRPQPPPCSRFCVRFSERRPAPQTHRRSRQNAAQPASSHHGGMRGQDLHRGDHLGHRGHRPGGRTQRQPHAQVQHPRRSVRLLRPRGCQHQRLPRRCVTRRRPQWTVRRSPVSDSSVLSSTGTLSAV